MDDKRFLRDRETRAMDIASRIAPKMASWPVNTEYVHWTRVVNATEEARARLAAYFAARDEIEGDPRLTAAGKAEEKRKAAQKALLGFAKSKALSRAEESVDGVMSKWDDQLKAALKPAANEVEAALHGEIRRYVAGLKDKQRLAFLEQNASDPIVAAAVLEAPPFLTGLTSAEAAMIKHKIEASVLPPK